MKKSVVSALTTALVIGTTATTFAAANPFSDVPAGHWAYNSVTKLAQEGVIEGYGDGTFLGNRNITRYEMAQMIAKAMAKNPQGASKAELDKLAAEFREELDNLGVRVAELEKHSDMVKWTGEVRYRYWNDHETLKDGGRQKRTRSQVQIRLFPTAEINDHWTAKARFTATEDFSDDRTGDVTLTYIFAEGNYGKFNVKLGRMPFFSNADEGLIVDDFFSGVQLTYGDKFKVKADVGAWNLNNSKLSSTVTDDTTANYQGIELLYDDKERFNAGLSYRHFNSDFFKGVSGYGADQDDANIWAIGAGYKFAGTTRLFGTYARNTKADNYKKGYNIELSYKGANRNNPGSWGVFAAYRYVGINLGLASTYDPFGRRANKKGVELGATWTPLKNIWTKLSYFNGKTLDTNEKDRTFFGRVSFYF